METARGTFEILYQDQDLVVMDKPWGFHVHRPEDSPIQVARSRICLPLLRAQLGQYIYPVHRLDVATTGLLVWALSSEMASLLGQQFQNQSIKKKYEAIVRGWTLGEFSVDLPLNDVPCLTQFQKLRQVEFQFPVGKKFPTAKYSWLSVTPQTGRYHQIRRHLNRVSHPIVGDTDHGDSHHNRFFRERLGQTGLCLRAFELEFTHPRTNEVLHLRARKNRKWAMLEKIFAHPEEALQRSAHEFPTDVQVLPSKN